MLMSHKNILPASIAIIGGMIFALGQPEQIMANNRVGYTPPERPEPRRTQGGGSRLNEQSEIVLLHLFSSNTSKLNNVVSH